MEAHEGWSAELQVQVDRNRVKAQRELAAMILDRGGIAYIAHYLTRDHELSDAYDNKTVYNAIVRSLGEVCQKATLAAGARDEFFEGVFDVWQASTIVTNFKSAIEWHSSTHGGLISSPLHRLREHNAFPSSGSLFNQRTPGIDLPSSGVING